MRLSIDAGELEVEGYEMSSRDIIEDVEEPRLEGVRIDLHGCSSPTVRVTNRGGVILAERLRDPSQARVAPAK
jgi:hypothetical protein